MTKRAAYTYGVDSGPKYWKSLEEYAETPEVHDAVAREFPDGASELADPVSRRSFIGLMGASLGLAGLQACRRPEEKILTYTKRPEDLVPGQPQYYATALPWVGGAIGLLVESHEGRPTKVEGNPQHPDSLGAANVYAQATVLDLYDPARSQAPREKDAKRSWSDAAKWLKIRGEAAAAKNGKGLAILVDAHRSPSLQAQLDKVKAQWPEATIVRWEPLSRDNVREGAKLAFGKALEPVYDLAGTKVVLTLDSDLFIDDPGALRHTRAFADGRRLQGAGDAMNRMYSVESRFSITGTNADHRLRLSSRDVGAFTAALAKELASAHGLAIAADLGAAKTPAGAEKWVKAIAKDLAANKGSVVVAVGAQQPAAVHALAALVNAALEAKVRWVQPFSTEKDGAEGITALAQSMAQGAIETLVILGGNPVFDAPADAKFADALAKVPASAHLSLHDDETSKATTWHLNGAHLFETWGDTRAQDGTLSVVQPLIAPLFDGKTATQVLEALLGGTRGAYAIVTETWNAQGLGGNWRTALHDGLLAGSAYPAETPAAAPGDLAAALATVGQGQGLELTFFPDAHAWDGRFANNGWLNEMPDQMTKVTWGNGVLVSPTTAKELGLKDGDTVELSVGGRTATFATVVQPGQADGSIAVPVGGGRAFQGRVGSAKDIAETFGGNAYPLRAATAFWSVSGAAVKAAGGTEFLARTQEHHQMAAPTLGGFAQPVRPLVRESTLVQFKSRPTFAGEMVPYPKKTEKDANGNEKKVAFNLYGDFKEHEYNGHKWGMVIDLNSCVGCNACMIACQSENNIPLVGKDGVIKGREMHWIRVDRYFTGSLENPQAVMQPIGCHHCENAPCELVCPVAATTHSTEGLNEMTYNRCVGTRYCANNCPYKVRRFNFFNYSKDVPELRRMQFNPDVTVRSRGVMEKCTYCVQRLQEAKLARKREAAAEGSNDMRIKDGAAVAACQQTCPANAISFGDLNDASSKVAQAAANPRVYRLLEELNTRPRTHFLARVRNPNPELEAA